MTHPCVYRHDARCPECGSNRMPKDGVSKGRQVYYCGECHRYHIPEASYQRPSAASKERGLAMYPRRQFAERSGADLWGKPPDGEPAG